MSLPANKPAQPSIRSFFQAQPPKYTAPPSQKPAPPPPSFVPASGPITTIEASSAQDGESKAIEIPPLPPTLPSEANIRLARPSDVNALRRINSLLLQVSYPETFYARLAKPAEGRFSRIITWTHAGEEAKVVGGVVCRVEPATSAGPSTLYIQSLCLLSPYRGLGLINVALDNIIADVAADKELKVRTATAHVWTNNEEGLKWYEGRGFKKGTQPIKGYYLKLRPDSAWLVERGLTASALNSAPTSGTSTPPSSKSISASPTAAVVNLPPMNGAAPPQSNGISRPPPRASSRSYQNVGPEMEWNDLPTDMAPPRPGPPKSGSEPTSADTSRSSSKAPKKKRDRSYPAAAFGAK